jgi:hypothetical protein
VEGLFPYTPPRVGLMKLKLRRKTHDCRNSLPIPRDSMQNPYFIKEILSNFQEKSSERIHYNLFHQ